MFRLFYWIIDKKIEILLQIRESLCIQFNDSQSFSHFSLTVVYA